MFVKIFMGLYVLVVRHISSHLKGILSNWSTMKRFENIPEGTPQRNGCTHDPPAGAGVQCHTRADPPAPGNPEDQYQPLYALRQRVRAVACDYPRAVVPQMWWDHSDGSEVSDDFAKGILTNSRLIENAERYKRNG